MRLCLKRPTKSHRKPLAGLALCLALAAMLLALPLAAPAEEHHPAKPHVHGPDCDHDLAPAPRPKPKLTPEQLAEYKRHREAAFAKARAQFAAMNCSAAAAPITGGAPWPPISSGMLRFCHSPSFMRSNGR